MSTVGLWVILALMGMILSMIGGYFTGRIPGLAVGLVGGLIPFVAIMQIINVAKFRGFLPLYKNLDKDENFVWIPNHMGKLKLFIMKMKHKGILYKKGLGIFEHKGTEFSFGGDPMCFAFPESAYTVNFDVEQYFSLLSNEEDLDDYEDCVKEYLGEEKYKEFCQKFRANPKPSYYHIKSELEYLIDTKPNNDLSKVVFGQTADFTAACKYLLYNYDPITSENATERERIIALKEGMDYREENRDINRAKAIVYIMLGAGILIIMLSAVNWEKIGLF